MASYKRLYEAALEEAKALQIQIEQLKSLDSMMERLTEQDEREFAESFIDRCNNRAEVALLVRILNRLGA